MGPQLGGRRFVTFDVLTALGFLAFRERAVECQVVEVGLGGRLDSTNVFQAPEVCAITSVGLEHTEVLGDTVEAIAAEKAGIIRPGATVVLGPQRHESAGHVVREVARSLGCGLVDVAAEYAWRALSRDLNGQRFRLKRPRGALDLSMPLLGEHQLANAATAVACADALAERGLALSDDAIVRGLANVSWPGRMEVLQRKPLVIADGAHSGDAAAALRDSLTHYLSGRRALFIIGVSAGKDAEALARELAPIAERVIAVRSRHPRALAAEEVAAVFAANGTDTEIGGGVAEALDVALATAREETVICLTGSLFVVAEGRAHLRGIEVTA
jgi:dihydrofolate synthase/folylpolyglutamate synthase